MATDTVSGRVTSWQVQPAPKAEVTVSTVAVLTFTYALSVAVQVPAVRAQ